MRKSIIAAGILALASPLAVFGTAGHASAASCTSDARIVETAYFHASNGSRVGSLELYYSPSCDEVWARGESNWAYGGLAIVQDVLTGSYQYCNIPSSADAYCDSPAIAADPVYGDYADGQIYDSSGNAYPGQTATYY
jgi:hypothetical protein